MKVVLAEKPSVARELASFLGADARRDGYFEGKGYQVVWALGHLVGLKEPQDYDPALKRWSMDSLPIVPGEFGLKPLDQAGAGKQLAAIRRLFRQADELICATDAGREGELIFRYILALTDCEAKPARRLWLSSLTREAIRDAFGRLKPLAEYDALYAAARCRSEADWLVGLNATRYYTVKHRAGGVLWSVGRVQTPVLAMIVRRDDEIRCFKPEPFWELMTRYREVSFKFVGERFAKEDEARDLLARVDGEPLTIQGVEKKPERALPPQLYDLTDLQRDMNRRYGLSADATLKAAQSLYEAKLISYPRTDSRHIGNDLKGKVAKILEDLRPLKPAEIGALDLDALSFHKRIVDDARVGDHHAIIPTGKRPAGLAPALQKVYDAVVTRLIAAFYPACVKEVTSVSAVSAGVPFRARGVRVVEPGWTVLYPRKEDPKKGDAMQEMPAFRPGESGPHSPEVVRGETVPPKPFNEDSLLGFMETAGRLVDDEQLREALKAKGLGTPATRASIIETLLTRGYIERDGKTLTATDSGRYLIAVVEDRGLKSPELTGEWEASLREIERGALDPRQFMAEIVRYTGDLVRSRFTSAIDPERLGDCPRCQRPVIAGKRGFGCSGWRDGCTFVLWREYEGHPLGEDQVRELLQHRHLVLPSDASKLLHLTDQGALTEIPIPVDRSRRFGESAGRRPSGAKAAPRTRRKGASAAKPKGAKEPKVEAEAAPGSAVSLGPCPVCKSEVTVQDKSYRCSGWRGGCKFAIWKTIAGQRIGVRTAKTLLTKGRTPVLKGFESKSGKPFDARLKVDGGEVRFDFGA
ncbi:DNA topoisomerase 3 [Tundrisphaera sp. TA3]|uniref:type IA DNA topoisomerase n=1 Tax=Tundrisphaera sp. TA3 TaxID=3435775 RepID=UPI003EBC3CA5